MSSAAWSSFQITTMYDYLRPKETQTSCKTLWILLKPRPTVATSACDCAKEMVCKVMIKMSEFLPSRVSVSPFHLTFQCVLLHAHAGLCLPYFQVTIRTAPVGRRVCDVTRWGLLIANWLTWARQWTCERSLVANRTSSDSWFFIVVWEIWRPSLGILIWIPDPPNLLNWRPVAMAFWTSWKHHKPRSKLVEPPLPALDLDSHCRQDIVLARPLDGSATMRG